MASTRRIDDKLRASLQLDSSKSRRVVCSGAFAVPKTNRPPSGTTLTKYAPSRPFTTARSLHPVDSSDGLAVPPILLSGGGGGKSAIGVGKAGARGKGASVGGICVGVGDGIGVGVGDGIGVGVSAVACIDDAIVDSPIRSSNVNPQVDSIIISAGNSKSRFSAD